MIHGIIHPFTFFSTLFRNSKHRSVILFLLFCVMIISLYQCGDDDDDDDDDGGGGDDDDTDTDADADASNSYCYHCNQGDYHIT